MSTRPEAPEPIAPEEARQALEAAIAPYLADGWIVLVEHDYMARLTKGRRNLEFFVDLLGEVSVTESGLSPVQEAGRLVAWLLLLVAFLLVVALASALGWL
ncbi:MAG: hypothetical protein JXN59_07565 [Anaerolineae bacterium]|nr:hypothetical protein [Anaerolineae bacterium]